MHPKLSILVVDDENYVREALSNLLREHGHQVMGAGDGQLALGLLGQMPFDVILSDIKMPVLDGFSLLKEVKQAFPEVAVVMMTGYSQEFNVREALALGADDYISKPFRGPEILLILEKAYRGSQSRKARIEAVEEPEVI